MLVKSMRLGSFTLTVLILAAFFAALSTPAKAAVLYDSGDPTPNEQLVLEYVNRARSNPVAEGQRLGIDIHEGLQNPGLVGPRPPLAMNKLLLGIASAHSQDMYSQNYFSHNDLNGTSPFGRMTHAGYNYVLAGENMAAGTDITAAELEDFMMVDAGTPGRLHRVNLLDVNPYPCGYYPCVYSEVGIGYYEGSVSNSIGNAFITEDFGATSNGPFLLGVVYNDRNGNNFYDIGEGIAGVTITPSTGGYYAVSSSSGGYTIPIGTSGTITVTASGQGFGPITRTVTLTGVNVKLDFTTQTSTSMTTYVTSTQTTTQTTSQLTAQTSFTSTTAMFFQVSPTNFVGATTPGTITACGSTYTNGQSAANCGSSFTATANMPTPSAGWRFDHWLWTGGLTCSSVAANSLSCTASGPGGSLMAVYGSQITFITNPASSALLGWVSCSNLSQGNGASFFSTGYGSASVTACYVPPGYTLSSWSCSGGLACTGSGNSTTVAFSGPGTIILNLQVQTLTTSSSTVSIASSSTPTLTVTTSTTESSPEFEFEGTVIISAVLAVFLTLFGRKASRRQ